MIGGTSNMKKVSRFSARLFWLELAFIFVISLAFWRANTPTNVLNSHFLYRLLDYVGLAGCILLPAGIPVGIIGIIMSRTKPKTRVPTLILSIINVSVGSFVIIMLLVLFGALLLGKISV